MLFIYLSLFWTNPCLTEDVELRDDRRFCKMSQERLRQAAQPPEIAGPIVADEISLLHEQSHAPPISDVRLLGTPFACLICPAVDTTQAMKITRNLDSLHVNNITSARNESTWGTTNH